MHVDEIEKEEGKRIGGKGFKRLGGLTGKRTREGEGTDMGADVTVAIADKVIVVTGASSGIGEAVAVMAAAQGASIALIARREDVLKSVAQRCGPNVAVIPADMTDRAAVKRAVAAVIKRFGHIDVWINNAGQGITRMPSELTGDDIDVMMNVNVKTALYGMQEVLPHFKERKAGQIINVSSMLGRIPYALPRAAYNGAKHYLNALTANFRMEFADPYPGIRFSVVSPGIVATKFGLNARHGGVDSRTMPDAQTANQVAEVVLKVIAEGKNDVYTRPGSRERVVEYYSALGENP
jgi:NADP-dependent 3-hydroxy acid dehydrogenase YdfG